jgi:hypothetical protein
MLKLLRPAALVGTLLLSTAVFPEWLAAQEFAQDRLGICPLYNLSGYTTIDSHGDLVNLMDYCQGISTAPDTRGEQFWDNFSRAADNEAIAYAQQLGQAEVTAYSKTICPFLKNGGTLEELRQVQADQQFPPNFEAPLTVAAIHTYCPTYRSAIGHPGQ